MTTPQCPARCADCAGGAAAAGEHPQYHGDAGVSR